MENKFYFVKLEDYETKEFTIIGALSPEEEDCIMHKVAEMNRSGANLQRSTCNTNISIQKQIDDFLKVDDGYKQISASEFLNKIGLNVNIK